MKETDVINLLQKQVKELAKNYKDLQKRISDLELEKLSEEENGKHTNEHPSQNEGVVRK
jgi:membrane protein involved in colicin uptake